MYQQFSSCKLCPRRCGVDRNNGDLGFCRAGAKIKIARAAPHFWEEPCISGQKGTGAVFFSHCTLGCAFCQNGEISRGGFGVEITEDRLADIFFELAEKGVHSISLITASHYLPPVIEAVKNAKRRGLTLPFVYNCGGYESIETIDALSPYIDIWLPDFKYFSADLAGKYSLASDYPEAALAAIERMLRRSGSARIGDDGLIERGVIIRHLLLPGKLADSMKAVSLLYERFGDGVIFSLMSQYTPPENADFARRFPELCRRVSPRHYEALVDFAAGLGITRCYIQSGDSADSSFTPPFDGEGVATAPQA